MSDNARSVLRSGISIIEKTRPDSAAFDAGCLFEDICGLTRSDLVLTPDITLHDGLAERFTAACRRRAQGEPLQYILGRWEFMGLEFSVNRGVLIPRADTETVVEYILDNYSGPLSVLDMCCGSGCIGLAVKHFLPEAEVTLADVSDDALNTAAINAKKLGLDVTVCKADLLNGCLKYFNEQRFDIIVSNPPYIKTSDIDGLQKEVLFEPRLALDGGADGMKFYRALILGWEKALKPGGEMVLESGYDTADDIFLTFLECEYCDIKNRKDLSGITRAVCAKRRNIYE